MNTLYLNLKPKTDFKFRTIYKQDSITFMEIDYDDMAAWCNEFRFKYETAVNNPYYLEIANKETRTSKRFKLLEQATYVHYWECVGDSNLMLCVVKH